MMYDFIVVGAGIAGASVAYELASSCSVCLIEGENRPGVHATGRSAALFAPSYGGLEIRALTRASRRFFEQPPEGFCEQPLLRQRGMLYIAREDQCSRLNQMVDTLRASGGSIALMPETEAVAQVPLLRKAYLAQAALDPDAMDIDVNSLHQGYLRGTRAAGAELITEQWLTRVQHRDGVWSIEIGDRRVAAPVLINAAGAWADELAIACGARPIGLQPLRRTVFLVDSPPGIDIRNWPFVIDADETFYFKPDAGKLLISPADETPDQPGDAQVDDMDIAIGVDRIETALDLEVRRVSHSWAGLRTFATDRVPVLGFDAEVPGLFWCAGQGGYGIQTAPAMARTAAALAKNERVPSDVATEGVTWGNLSPFRFETLPRQRMER
jgi:D-arginine dehydrogenase